MSSYKTCSYERIGVLETGVVVLLSCNGEKSASEHTHPHIKVAVLMEIGRVDDSRKHCYEH